MKRMNCGAPCCHQPTNCCCTPIHDCNPCKPVCPRPCPSCPPAPVTYSVVYSPNGGTGGTADFNLPAGSHYTIKSPALAGVSRPGYTFIVWNTEPDGSGTVYVPGDMIALKMNLILYAQWEVELPNTVMVIYDPNGGQGGTADTDIPLSSSYTIKTAAEANVSRPGHIFRGWNTDPDGEGIAYTPGSVIPLTASLTLYAQWAVSITYDPGFANGTPQTEYADVGSAYTIKAVSAFGFALAGYAFTVWNTDILGNGENYAPGETITVTENLALFAQWRLGTGG